jgi:hypothetical protein
LKPFIFRSLGLLLAWVVALLIPTFIDGVFGTSLRQFVSMWLWGGMLVMLIKKIPPPLPSPERIDVVGAFKMLWWAAWWPLYLFR